MCWWVVHAHVWVNVKGLGGGEFGAMVNGKCAKVIYYYYTYDRVVFEGEFRIEMNFGVNSGSGLISTSFVGRSRAGRYRVYTTRAPGIPIKTATSPPGSTAYRWRNARPPKAGVAEISSCRVTPTPPKKNIPKSLRNVYGSFSLLLAIDVEQRKVRCIISNYIIRVQKLHLYFLHFT